MVAIIFFRVNTQDTNKHILSFLPTTPNYAQVILCSQETQCFHDLQLGFSLLQGKPELSTKSGAPVKAKLGAKQRSNDIMRGRISCSPLGCLHKVEFESWGSCLHRQQSTCSLGKHKTLTLSVCVGPLTPLITCWQYKQSSQLRRDSF